MDCLTSLTSLSRILKNLRTHSFHFMLKIAQSVHLTYIARQVMCGEALGIGDLEHVEREKARHLLGLLEAAQKGWPDISNYCLTFEYEPPSR